MLSRGARAQIEAETEELEQARKICNHDGIRKGIESLGLLLAAYDSRFYLLRLSRPLWLCFRQGKVVSQTSQSTHATPVNVSLTAGDSARIAISTTCAIPNSLSWVSVR